MSQKKNKILWGMIAIILCIPGIWLAREGIAIWKDVQQQKAEDRQILLEISQRLGVETNWDVVTRFLYCDLLHSGMTVTEVESVMEKIGPYWNPLMIGNSGIREIDFQDPNISSKLSPLILDFSNGNLVKWTFGESYLGTIPECE